MKKMLKYKGVEYDFLTLKYIANKYFDKAIMIKIDFFMIPKEVNPLLHVLAPADLKLAYKRGFINDKEYAEYYLAHIQQHYTADFLLKNLQGKIIIGSSFGTAQTANRNIIARWLEKEKKAKWFDCNTEIDLSCLEVIER